MEFNYAGRDRGWVDEDKVSSIYIYETASIASVLENSVRVKCLYDVDNYAL